MASVCANCGFIDAFEPVIDGAGEIVCGNCPHDAQLARLGALAQNAAEEEAESVAEALAALSLVAPAVGGAGEAPAVGGAGGGHPKGHYRNAATRSKRDFYQTPAQLTEAIVKFIPESVKIIWEPCWGAGAIAKVLAAVKNTDGSPRFSVVGTDLYSDAPQGKLDFLTQPPAFAYDMIITNPPWNDKPAWLNRFTSTGRPFFALYPLSIMAGVATTTIFTRTPAKFFIANKHVKFEHEGKMTDVGDVVWIGSGLAADLPVLSWLDMGGGRIAKVPKLRLNDEKLAVKLALEEKESLNDDHNLAVALALKEMEELEPILPYYTPLDKLLLERIITQPPVPLTEGRRRVLELFAGSGSFSKAFLKEYPLGEAVRVELDPAFGAEHTADILRWSYQIYPPGTFWAIHASPPCREYSRMRPATGVPRDLAMADQLVAKVFEIVAWFKPRFLLIENPGGIGAKLPERFNGIKQRAKDLGMEVPSLREPVTAHYCSYGYLYRKPTAFWSNVPLTLKTCEGPGKCHAMHEVVNAETGKVGHQHKESIGTAKPPYKVASAALRATIPPALMESIIKQAADYL